MRLRRSAAIITLALACRVLGETPPLAHATPNGAPDEPTPTVSAEAPPLGAASQPGDELLMFEDLQVVISSARRAQPISASPVAVTVVTAEDIHRSGLTSIPDILTFALGVDVVQVDRNRFAIGVRGLHHSFAERTLFLINGRDASTPVFGGVDFGRLPVLLEDIERIEIVRGPAGAAWGPNAFNGLINIITKRPDTVQGLFTSTTVNEFGDTYSHLRWGAEAQDWQWRLSLGYEQHDSSEDILDATDFSSQDFGDVARFDGEAIHQLSHHTTLTLGLGYAHVDRGDFEFSGHPASEDERLDTVRAFARLDRQPSTSGSWYLQWFANVEDAERPTLWDFTSVENDLEVQGSFAWHPQHELLVGGNFRWLHLDLDTPTASQTDVPREPFDHLWLGAFLLDRWQATEHLSIEGQLRGDWYSESEVDWSGRLTGLYGLDHANRHVLRAGMARAFRAPLPAVAETAGTGGPLPSPPFPPDSFAFRLVRANDLDNERTWSVEGGYFGALADGLTIRADGYYQHYANMIVTRSLSPPPMSSITFANGGAGEAVGTELELRLRRSRWEAAAWYSYHDFEPDEDDVSLRALLPPRNKAGIRGHLSLGYGLDLGTTYQFTDFTEATSRASSNVGSSHRWDLTLAKTFADGRAELLVGVRDLLDETELVIVESPSTMGPETPGRIVFFRGQLKF